MSNKRQKLVKDIAERLRSVRIKNYLTIDVMHKRLGVSRDCYHKNESAKTLIGLETLDLLHRDFDISVEWLFFGLGPMRASEVGVQTDPVSSKRSLTPEIEGVLAMMEKDSRFRLRVLAMYFDLKKEKAG